MMRIENAGRKTLSKIYGQLFTQMWNEARKTKKVSGRIVYARMTPPWLRHNVTFVHGQNRNESTVFTSGKLPTKSEIREIGKATLAAAILTTFLQKEKEVHLFLTRLLQRNSIELPYGESSSSTIEITRENCGRTQFEPDSSDSREETTNDISESPVFEFPPRLPNPQSPAQTVTNNSRTNSMSTNQRQPPPLCYSSTNNNVERERTENTNRTVYSSRAMTNSQFLAEHLPTPTSRLFPRLPFSYR